MKDVMKESNEVTTVGYHSEALSLTFVLVFEPLFFYSIPEEANLFISLDLLCFLQVTTGTLNGRKRHFLNL